MNSKTRYAFVEEKRTISILIVLAVLMLIGAVPAWPHSRNWGYGPGGGLGMIILALLSCS